ncbi:MAG: hypothetical protein AAF212_07465, partial [Verrucomicrobiota bacterium]
VNTLTVRDLRITGTDLGILDIDALWISDAPEFLENPPEITVKNRSEQIYAHVRADTLRDPLSKSPITLEARDFEIESVRSLLPSDLAQSVEAGKITVLAEGVLQEQSLQIPINAQLSALQIQIPKVGMQEIESLALQGSLAGPIDALKVSLDTRQLQQELQNAAQSAIQDAAKNRLSEEIEKRLGDDDSEDGGVKNILRGFLNP